jgi:diguanylate cyclase (GGDEF)-like protein
MQGKRNGFGRVSRSRYLLLLNRAQFSVLNDSLVHEAGDEIIKGTARQLADAVEGKGQAFRYGGEEFVLLLPGMEREEALIFMEGVSEAVLLREGIDDLFRKYIDVPRT